MNCNKSGIKVQQQAIRENSARKKDYSGVRNIKTSKIQKNKKCSDDEEFEL